LRLPLFNSKTMTGIDIQPEGVHLVQLSHHKQSYSLQKTGFFPLKAALFDEGRISNWEGLTSQLFDCAREFDLVGAVVAAALPAPAVRLFCADIAETASELQVRDCLEDELPGLGEALAIDYCALQSRPSAMAVAVTKRDYLERYIASLMEAGFDLKVMDIDSCAIQRAMRCDNSALLWQRRDTFTLIWQDEKQLPQQIQWLASYGEQNIAALSKQLAHTGVTQLRFCGSSYYRDLLIKAQSQLCTIQTFTPDFIKSESKVLTSSINLSDYLLAIGLAMREAPVW
jgi:hypothetical protein